MVTLEMLEIVENGTNEIKEKCLEILKYKKEQDKNNLLKIDKDILSSKICNIDYIDIENNKVYITMSFYHYGENYEGNYEINFEEITNENWQEDFLKELNELELKYLLKKELEEQEKIEQMILKEKEEYKRLREKFEGIYGKNNSDKI